MCYVIAKDRYAHGCIAFETVHGKHLADLETVSDRALGNTGGRDYDHQPPRKPMGNTHPITLCRQRRSSLHRY